MTPAHARRMRALLNQDERLDLDEPEYDALDQDEIFRLDRSRPTRSLLSCGKGGSATHVDWDAIDQMRTRKGSR